MNDIARNVNIAAVAELISDPSRAAMLDALMGKQALPAGELARKAGIAPQTASTHLSKLVDGGLLLLIRQGRHRYYQLANTDVARALEALATIAPPAHAHSLRESIVAEQLRCARTCYDHLAGKLGVQLAQTLHDRDILQFEEQDRKYRVTEEGTRFLTQFGIDLEQLQGLRRAFALPCLDWSERRYHLAGALGAAFAERFFQLGWIEKLPKSRAVRLTENGRAGLVETFGEHFQW
jgi:DNA-binding transcriptional ArsR family regulator